MQTRALLPVALLRKGRMQARNASKVRQTNNLCLMIKNVGRAEHPARGDERIQPSGGKQALFGRRAERFSFPRHKIQTGQKMTFARVFAETRAFFLRHVRNFARK